MEKCSFVESFFEWKLSKIKGERWQEIGRLIWWKKLDPDLFLKSFKVFEGETPARHLLFGGIVGVLFWPNLQAEWYVQYERQLVLGKTWVPC